MQLNTVKMFFFWFLCVFSFLALLALVTLELVISVVPAQLDGCVIGQQVDLMEVVGSISSPSIEFEVESSFIIPPCASVLAPLSSTRPACKKQY